MRINTNISAMHAWRSLNSVDGHLAKSMERLSSGLRVNRASDDAAGLSISENLNAQLRGQRQAMKNVQDGLSALRIADGGLNEIHAALQRMRELAVQGANGTYTAEQRQVIHDEAIALASEIDAIAMNTTFNGIQLLSASRYSDADRQALLDALQNGVMKDGYDAVINAFGLTHDAVPELPVIFEDDIAGGTVAFVRGSLAPVGNPGTLELHLDLSWWIPLALNGSAGAINAMTEVMAHEMTHAVMFDETNMNGFPTWFVEGIAEFVPGGESRVASTLAGMGGNTPANRQALIDRLSNSSWGGTSADYAAGYLATRYLDDQLAAAGIPGIGGIEDVMATRLDVDADPAANDMDYVVGLLGYVDTDDFLTTFQSAGVGEPYVASLLSDGDALGALNGGISVTGSAADPTPWDEIWPTNQTAEVILQTGANNGEELTLALTSVTAGSLGVGNLDLVGAAGAGITAIDTAIAQVSSIRSALGAQANRLEHTLANLGTASENQAAAYSRIRDYDMAAGMTTLTRQQILFQSAHGMLAQAQFKDAGLLELLA